MRLLSRLVIVLPLLLAPVIHAKQNWQHVQEIEEEIPVAQPPNEKPQIIIQSVANIISHVGSIVGDPHNKQTIGQNVTGILAHIVNIALVAGKRTYKNQQELLTALCDELHLDEETRVIIQQKLEEIQAKHQHI